MAYEGLMLVPVKPQPTPPRQSHQPKVKGCFFGMSATAAILNKDVIIHGQQPPDDERPGRFGSHEVSNLGECHMKRTTDRKGSVTARIWVITHQSKCLGHFRRRFPSPKLIAILESRGVDGFVPNIGFWGKLKLVGRFNPLKKYSSIWIISN